MANVDWMPASMSFAGLIPSEYTQISFDNDNTGNTDVPIAIDGYIMYLYIMSTDTDMTPISYQIMFQIRPLNDDSNYASTIYKGDIHSKVFRKDIADIIDGLSSNEVALVFHDSSGKLWKYFDAEESTNEVGNLQVNCSWCILNINSNNDSVYTYHNSSDSITRGLYDLDNDFSVDIQKTLKLTVIKNILQHFNNEYSDSSVYLYSNFDCFYNSVSDSQTRSYSRGDYEILFESRRKLLARPKSTDNREQFLHLHEYSWNVVIVIPSVVVRNIIRVVDRVEETDSSILMDDNDVYVMILLIFGDHALFVGIRTGWLRYSDSIIHHIAFSKDNLYIYLCCNNTLSLFATAIFQPIVKYRHYKSLKYRPWEMHNFGRPRPIMSRSTLGADTTTIGARETEPLINKKEKKRKSKKQKKRRSILDEKDGVIQIKHCE